MSSRRFFLLGILLECSSLFFAQSSFRQYVDVSVGGGLHSFLCSPKEISHGMGGGGLFQARYKMMFNENWGFATGLQFATYADRAQYDDAVVSYKLVHPNMLLEDNSFRLKIYPSGEEHDALYALQVPLQVNYVYPLNDKWFMNGAFGISFDIPMAGKFSLKDVQMTTTGTPTATNVEISNVGYLFDTYSFSDSDVDGKLPINYFNMGLQLDFAMGLHIKNNISLLFGLYFNVGLLPAVKSDLEAFFDAKNAFSQTGKYRYVEVFNTDLISSARPFELGVKVGVELELFK